MVDEVVTIVCYEEETKNFDIKASCNMNSQDTASSFPVPN